MGPLFVSLFLFFFLGLPGIAHAWGTGAHVDFAMQIIADAALLAPAVRHLIQRFPKSYLYGNLAADTVIGKNLASADDHVHNWEVALRLFDLVGDDRDRAFVYGYLSHLSADTVAHNFFVPKKRVDSFRSVGAGHAYWELRYDSFLPEAVWDHSRSLGRERFPGHDELLNQGLRAPILNVQANRLVWDGFLGLTRRVDRWRHLMRAHAEKSKTPFDPAERAELRSLAVAAITDFLNHFRDSKTFRADPTGSANLDRCWQIGAMLRRTTGSGSMDPREADEIARRVGRALRESLHQAREADLTDALRA